MVDNIKDVFRVIWEFRGSGFLLVLYAAALIYLFITEKNKKTPDGFKYQALYSYKLRFNFTTDAGILNYLNGREFEVKDVPFVK